MIAWELNAVAFTNCNCDYGCPCQFNALPTHGNCEAVHSMHIERGYFGDTQLDDLCVVTCLWWPGPIHEGGGRVFAIIDERASQAQRECLLKILTGQETEPGATIWNVFAATIDELLEPAFQTIDMEIDIAARTSRIRVNELVSSAGTPILNPVTGIEHRAQIHLPQGFEYSVAEMASGTTETLGPIQISLTDSYGQFNEIHLNNYGLVA